MYLQKHQIIHFILFLPKPKGNIWYYKKAAGRETLGNVVKKVMGKARFDGHFTNQSLRRSCATNLYDNGVPEQVIQRKVSDKGEVSVWNIRINALNAESMEERHDKVETKGESLKNIVITTAETKIVCYK